MRLIIAFACFTIILNTASAQMAPKNWYHLDATEGYNGTSSYKTFTQLIKDKVGKTVVVAIIDSGIDVEHEDLKANIWKNPGEIAGNGIDDDKNGYVDDVHGWNFIGGPGGKNVGPETYEVTRLYSSMRYKYENADVEKLSKEQKMEYEKFLNYKTEVEGEREKATAQLQQIAAFETQVISGMNQIESAMGENPNNVEILKGDDPLTSLKLNDNPDVSIALNVAKQIMKQSEEITSIGQLKEELITVLAEEKQGSQNKLDYAYNPDYDSRKLIVKDNYNDSSERFYGNNDVEGPDALHGTHVAGIVGAMVGNEIGSEGIARNVKLMSVRAVPDGDERDKDVANAIIYAVDNGASIINMSFGKAYSWDKKAVDEAVKYAADQDVLLVHAAGNSGQDNDATDNFPNDYLGKHGFIFKKKCHADNWLEVGALSYKPSEDMVAGFSNYGKQNVDLFSPGVQIYATTPGDKYQYLQGTSMASPAAAGVAAVLRSYYPSLTAKQVKEILMKSVVPINTVVKKPGTKGAQKVSFTELSASGGTINLYNAFQLAAKTKGKKKIKELANKGA
ncbi:MAG: S8 family serine peptidase [Saprospiraceae bacterium]|nr:S8 family serine peptidase [Saprospiraceae bacterium]